MENYQNIKDKIPGGVAKLNQQKSNPLPPRGVAARTEIPKSPNYKQIGSQNSKNDYDYDIEDNQNPFQSGKNSIQNKIDSSNNVNKSNTSNNNTIYNKTASNISRNNTANYPQKYSQLDEQDDYDDEGYEENRQYSASNYSNQQQRKPATTSGAYSKGQRSTQQTNNQRKTYGRDEEEQEEQDDYNNYGNQDNDERDQYSNKQNQRKGTQQNNKYNNNQYDNQEDEEVDEIDDHHHQQKYQADTKKKVSTVTRSGSEQQTKEPQQNNRMMQRYQKVEEGLTVCPEGCGRTFNEFALEKHVKVCKKVFQDKRQAFDITQRRQGSQQNEQVQQDNEQKRQEIMRKQKEMHECSDCGRSFRYEVYEKHIKICVKVFTKKNRETSLYRKSSLNATGSNLVAGSNSNIPSKLPPQPSLLKKGNSQSNEAETDQKNQKKPPLKRNPLPTDKKEESGAGKRQSGQEFDDIPVGGSKSKNSWEETPIGGKSKNTWDDIPVGGGNKSNAQWDEYPQESSTPSVHSRTTAAQSETSNNPWDSRAQAKKVSQPPPQKKPWNDDWNSTTLDDNNDDFYNKNKKNDFEDDYQRQQQEKKNYNFNKNIKKNSQTSSKFQIENPTDQNYEHHNYENMKNNEDGNYIYSKPNIGKKIILSGKKSPLPESSKQQSQQRQHQQQQNAYNKGDYEDDENTYQFSSGVNRNQNKANTTKFDPYNQHQEEEQEQNATSQHSKPFLKKNQGIQPLTKGKTALQNINQQHQQQQQQQSNNQQQNRGGNQHQQFQQSSQIEDIPINKNNEFNRQLMEMERKAAQISDLDLTECPEGCGRKFAEQALEKHVKVCKKVFQQKRKVFNSAAFRQVEDQEGGSSAPSATTYQKKPPQKKQVPTQKAQQYDNNNYGQKPPQTSSQGNKQSQLPFDKKQTNENTKVGQKKADWKKQSEAFRAAMRSGKGGPTSEYDNAIMKEAFQRDDYVQCEYCSRRFNEQAAERHIPYCKTKSQLNHIKQGGKSNNLKTQKSFTPSNRKY